MITGNNLIAHSKQLWTQDEEFHPDWELRNKLIASYINIPGIVADFGCGKMTLEKYLKPNNSYLPIDVHRRDNRTIVFDVNRHSLPSINADIAVCSGFLEYVVDLRQFVHSIQNCRFKMFIMSYCTTNDFPDLRKRRSLNWVSHLSISDILYLFLSQFNLSAIDDFNKNSIFVWITKN